MAEAFGETWLTAYEEALEKQEWDEDTGEGFFVGRWTENAEEYYRAVVYGNEKTLAENAKKYYYLEFYDTIEGILVKRCNVSWEVDANALAEDSYYYGASWVSPVISFSGTGGNVIARLTVTESGFDLDVQFGSPTGYEMLYEP